MPSDYFYEADHTENPNFPVIPAHEHNFFEIYVYLKGSIRLAVENKVFDVKRGDIIVIPPFCIHQLLPIHRDRAYERAYLYVSIPCLKSLQFNEYTLLQPLLHASEEKRYHFHIANEAEYNSILNAIDILHASKQKDYYGKEQLNRSALLQLLTLLNKHILQDLNPRENSSVNPVIEEILGYINEHYNEYLTLDFLADRFFINKYTLTKLFKKHTALTIHNYILLKRISLAKQKMMEGVLPSKVYLETGFSDYSTFYRAFLKSENISPKEFHQFSSK